MDNPEKVATLGTHDTGQKETKQGAIKNGHLITTPLVSSNSS
jgi:hypothetical protein